MIAKFLPMNLLPNAAYRVAFSVLLACAAGVPAQAQDAKSILVVAGPRTPESLDQELSLIHI